MREYSQRTIAFIDILGFERMVNNERTKSHEVAEILDELHGSFEYNARSNVSEFGRRYRDSLEIAYFSDSIVLSCETESDSYLIDDICIMQIKLMRKGIFVRGCLVNGMLYHKENYIFGPAIIKAYKEESKIAKYPRIILGTDYDYEGTYFCRDYDGIYFLDPFRKIQEKDWNGIFSLHDAVTEIYEHVNRNLEIYKDNTEVFMKYSWLKQIMDELYYLEDGIYKYFWSSNSTYNRNEIHKSLRDSYRNRQGS